MAYDIAKLTKFFMNQMNFSDYDVMDCTACVGGDSFPQSLFARKVESYEINQETFELFKANMTILHEFGFESTQIIRIANSSCLPHVAQPQHLSSPYCAIFDPPWGGPEYKAQLKLRLQLDQQPIEQIALKCLQKAAMVLLKLPKNYDKDFLKQAFSKFQLHPFSFRNCLFVFILKTPILETKLRNFCVQHQILKEKSLFDDFNFQLFENLFPNSISVQEIKTFRSNVNFAISQTKKERIARILVKSAAKVDHLRDICLYFLLVEHLPVSIFITDSNLRSEFGKEVEKLPKFVFKQSEIEGQSINILEFGLDSYQLALSDDTEILADMSICDSYTVRFGQSYIKMKKCSEILAKLMKSAVWYE